MSLSEAASRVATLLTEKDLRLVLAESCTAGLVAASLATVPGISEHLCGSAVTYRNATKQAWLGVSPALLEMPGSVSPEVARAMALGVLDSTTEADVAASVTGHLGPGAPPELDGQIYIGWAWRSSDDCSAGSGKGIRLGRQSRLERQHEAAEQALDCVHHWLLEFEVIG